MHPVRPNQVRRPAVTLLLGALMLTGFAVLGASSSDSDRLASMTVNRANKGDQLQAPAAAPQPSRPPAAAKTGRPPLGCEAPVSPIVEPLQSRLYYRCAA